MEWITHSSEETEHFASQFAKLLSLGDVIAFRGSLGMGKTAFVRGLARGLGIEDPVSSPTFAIVNEYRRSGVTLCHFDMYRIDGYDDLYSTGFFDYLDTNAILAIEWSERIEGVLPRHTTWITLEQVGENRRRITIEGDHRFENFSG